MATLSHAEARRVYDRIGSWLDSQSFYEDRAIDRLLAHAELAEARAVFELGCGTGRLAERMLAELLPADATYRGVDLSPKMVSIAQRRVARWRERATVLLTEGGPPSAEPPGSCDRFVSTYVLDLLPQHEIHAVLADARRMLRPDGLLCLASLSTGSTRASRGFAAAWGWLQARRPALVAGCRPLDLRSFLPDADWELRFHDEIVAFAVPSEVVVARPRAFDGAASGDSDRVAGLRA